jgi:hypothetical protein
MQPEWRRKIVKIPGGVYKALGGGLLPSVAGYGPSFRDIGDSIILPHLPPDARITREGMCGDDFMRNLYSFEVESESFDPIPRGEPLPVIHLDAEAFGPLPEPSR